MGYTNGGMPVRCGRNRTMTKLRAIWFLIRSNRFVVFTIKNENMSCVTKVTVQDFPYISDALFETIESVCGKAIEETEKGLFERELNDMLKNTN